MAWTYKDYYKKNKTALLAKRRRRYREDVKYREQQIGRAKRSYKVKKKGNILSVDRRLVQGVDGRRFFSIGKVGQAINRKPYTIREYHKNGIIPEPNCFDNRGWRLYSAIQVRLLKRTFMMFDNGQLKTLQDVAGLLEGEWLDENKEGCDRERGVDDGIPHGIGEVRAEAL